MSAETKNPFTNTYTERIRHFRHFNNYTAKQLGIEMGIPESNADVRVFQYESGYRSPGEKSMEDLSLALHVSPMAIAVPDMSYDQIMHHLFALEDRTSCYPTIVGDDVHIEFRKGAAPAALYVSLVQWAIRHRNLKNQKIEESIYDVWRYTYPQRGLCEVTAYDPERDKMLDRVAEQMLCKESTEE